MLMLFFVKSIDLLDRLFSLPNLKYNSLKKIAANVLHWRRAGNSLLVLPGADAKLETKILN